MPSFQTPSDIRGNRRQRSKAPVVFRESCHPSNNHVPCHAREQLSRANSKPCNSPLAAQHQFGAMNQTPQIQKARRVEKGFGSQKGGALATFWQRRRQQRRRDEPWLLPSRRPERRFSYFVKRCRLSAFASTFICRDLRSVREQPAKKCRKSNFDKRFNARKLLMNRGLAAKPRFIAMLSLVFSVVSDFP